MVIMACVKRLMVCVLLGGSACVGVGSDERDAAFAEVRAWRWLLYRELLPGNQSVAADQSYVEQAQHIFAVSNSAALDGIRDGRILKTRKQDWEMLGLVYHDGSIYVSMHATNVAQGWVSVEVDYQFANMGAHKYILMFRRIATGWHATVRLVGSS
jgi:hypothetical protein